MIDLDTFAGAGGASLAMASLGLDPIGYERDADACATHEAAGHRTVRCDMATERFDHLFGRVRLLHASPPCQPFSASGLHAGRLDPRDGMPHALRAIAECRPQLVTVENVRGLTFRKHAPYLSWFLGELAGLGYTVDHRVLNAADYGVPQTRQRLFVVGRADGVEPKWPDPTHAEGGVDGLAPWVSMAEALGWGMTAKPFGTVATCNTTGGIDSWGVGGSGARQGLRDEHAAGRWVMGWPRRADAGVIETLNGIDVRARDLRSADLPSLTIISANLPAYRRFDLDNTRALRVELHELAALQGFPPDYPFVGTRTSRARQIGNAVPPALLAAVIAANLGPVAP